MGSAPDEGQRRRLALAEQRWAVRRRCHPLIVLCTLGLLEHKVLVPGPPSDLTQYEEEAGCETSQQGG